MGSSGKDKDPTRADRKAKKRKLEASIPDLPGDIEAEQPESLQTADDKRGSKKRKHNEIAETILGDDEKYDRNINAQVVNKSKEEKRQKKQKKQKNLSQTPSQNEGEAETEKDETRTAVVEKLITSKQHKEIRQNYLTGDTTKEEAGLDCLLPVDGEPLKKTKKERKAEKKATKATQTISPQVEAPTSVAKEELMNGNSVEASQSKKNNRNRDKKRKAAYENAQSGTSREIAARFIVFIGNLPFSATTESIERHFATVKPKSVRHLTKKEDPSKSKGCAFVEFEGYDHMKTCLKLFHHSTFDDGISAPRKINVELTAGGGGKTKHRQAKIEEKNSKLNEQRSRRIHEEEKAKLDKREAATDHNDVHPSRRGRVPDTS